MNTVAVLLPAVLQWGPRLGRYAEPDACASFNGAPVSRRGGAAKMVVDTGQDELLQWGPRLSTGGSCAIVCCKRRWPTWLQWGPRLSTGGSAWPGSAARTRVRCFNGAPVSRRGGAERLPFLAFVTPMLQWGPRLSTGGRSLRRRTVTRWLVCFNGAPVSRRGGGRRD